MFTVLPAWLRDAWARISPGYEFFTRYHIPNNCPYVKIRPPRSQPTTTALFSPFQISTAVPPCASFTIRLAEKRDGGPKPQIKVVVNRPLPFSGTPVTRSDGRRRRRHRNSDGNTNGKEDGGALRAERNGLQAFRFHCRSGQLLFAEQLAIAGVWDISTSSGTGGHAGGGDPTVDGAGKSKDGAGGVPVGTSAGLRTAWMTARLKPAMRLALNERREKVRQALEDVRRLAGLRGAIFTLPRVAVETGMAAAVEWETRVVPSQRDVVRGKGDDGPRCPTKETKFIGVMSCPAPMGCGLWTLLFLKKKKNPATISVVTHCVAGMVQASDIG